MSIILTQALQSINQSVSQPTTNQLIDYSVGFREPADPFVCRLCLRRVCVSRRVCFAQTRAPPRCSLPPAAAPFYWEKPLVCRRHPLARCETIAHSTAGPLRPPPVLTASVPPLDRCLSRRAEPDWIKARPTRDAEMNSICSDSSGLFGAAPNISNSACSTATLGGSSSLLPERNFSLIRFLLRLNWRARAQFSLGPRLHALGEPEFLRRTPVDAPSSPRSLSPPA